jgi:hypothetical protein
MTPHLSEISRRYGMTANIIQCDPRSKKPTHPNWADERPPLTDEQLDTDAFNKGLVLLNNFAVLDIDDYGKANRFLSFYGIDLEVIRHDPANVVYHNDGPTSSAKGKFKVLFARPPELVLEHINRSTELGLELRTGRCQDILPGSIHPDGGVYVIDNAPDQLAPIGGMLLHIWKGMLGQTWRKARTPQGREQKEYDRLTDVQMQEHLNFLPEEWVEEYETWWKVGAALQRAEYPYELWAGWSKASAKWNARAALGKWNTNFGGCKSNNPFTIASIIKAARDNGHTGQGINDLMPAQPDLSKLGQPFYTPEEILAGQAPGDDEPEASPDQAFVALKDGYKFLRDEFVYVKQSRMFYHVARRVGYSVQTFSPAIAHELRPVKNSKGQPVPFNFAPVLAAPGLYMDMVDQIGFEPGQPRIATMMMDDSERVVLNECYYTRPRGVQPSKETTRILQGVFDHFTEGGTNSECVKVLTHQLRTLHFKMDHPATRFNYGHVLISPATGTGKSFFSLILPTLIFGSNVCKATVSDLESQFDASHKARNIITCIEEVKIGASNDRYFEREAHKTMDKLKDWMTAPTTTVNDKGDKKYKIPNYTCMFVTSNHVDCIPPQGAKDRRWIACISRAGTLSQVNPDLHRDSHRLLEQAQTNPLVMQEIIGWIETFVYKGIVQPTFAPFNTKAVAKMADMAETPLEESVRELFGPDRDASMPKLLTKEQVLTLLRDHTNNPNLIWGKQLKVALENLNIKHEMFQSRHKMQGNRVVQGSNGKTRIVLLEGHFEDLGMVPSDIVKTAMESCKPSLTAVP